MRKDEKSRRVLSIMFGFGRKSSGDGSRDYSEGKRAYDRKEYNSARMKGDPSHSRHHSAIALKNAKGITEVNAIEEDMIAKHMWPMTLKLPKYRETYVITVIDKYCAVLEFCVPQITRIAVRKRIKPSVTERKNIQGGYSNEY
jgi:hypothetical protein